MKRSFFRSNPRVIAPTVLLLTTAVLNGCTTTGFKFDEEKKQPPASAEVRIKQSGSMVQHSGHSVPAVTKLDRDSWVEIRKSTKDEHIKMYAALGAGEWDVAITDARHYIATHPKDVHSLIVLATSLAMARQYSLAAYYGGLLEQYHPGQPLAPNLLGLAVMHRPNATMRDFQKAAEYFRDSMDRSDREIAAALNLGHLQLAMGQARTAVVTFGAARSRCGDCTDAVMGYGVASSKAGDYENARDAFESVLAKEKRNAYALYRLALVERHGFQNDAKAKTYLDRLLSDTSNTNTDLKRRANTLLNRIEARNHAVASDEPSFYIEKQTVSDDEAIDE